MLFSIINDDELVSRLADDLRSVWDRTDLYRVCGRIEHHDQIEVGKVYEFYDTTTSMAYIVSVLKKDGTTILNEDGIAFDAKHYEIFKIV